MKTKDAVVEVLAAAEGPLLGREVVERVLPMIELRGKTPGATIAAFLSTESRKENGLVVKHEKRFALRNGTSSETATGE